MIDVFKLSIELEMLRFLQLTRPQRCKIAFYSLAEILNKLSRSNRERTFTLRSQWRFEEVRRPRLLTMLQSSPFDAESMGPTGPEISVEVFCTRPGRASSVVDIGAIVQSHRCTKCRTEVPFDEF